MPQTSISVRVPFHDVDSSGRIHFTAIFRYMDIAEHELRRFIGFPQVTSLPNIEFPRVHVACDFRGAIRFDDELAIEARVDRVGRSSWTVAFIVRITREAGHSEPTKPPPIAADGQMTVVAVDTTTDRAVPLPDELRSALIDT